MSGKKPTYKELADTIRHVQIILGRAPQSPGLIGPGELSPTAVINAIKVAVATVRV
jgi:hypothetical protein